MTSTIARPEDTVVDVEAARQQRVADAQAAGLRILADLLQAHPDIADEVAFCLANLSEPLIEREVMAKFAAAAAQHGAKIEKEFTEHSAGVKAHFGPVVMRLWNDRRAVCERIVTGTREVTEEVPDPEALAAVPTTRVTRVEDVVEWRCGSLLAPADEPKPVGR